MEKKYLPEAEMLPRLIMAREYDTKLIPIARRTPQRTAESFELSLYHTGGSILFINGIRYCVKQGDLRFNRPGDVLGSESHFCSSTLYFQFGSDGEECFNDFLDAIPTFSNGCDGFEYIFSQIIYYFNSEMPGSKAAQNALLLELLHGIYTQACSSVGHSEAVSKCIKYMKDHLNEKITLEDLGKLSGYCPIHVVRLFKSELNQSPHSFLSALRMERAKLLLSESDTPISQLALDCGFVSESYFYTFFRNTNGMTPSEYRRASRIF